MALSDLFVACQSLFIMISMNNIEYIAFDAIHEILINQRIYLFSTIVITILDFYTYLLILPCSKYGSYCLVYLFSTLTNHNEYEYSTLYIILWYI